MFIGAPDAKALSGAHLARFEYFNNTSGKFSENIMTVNTADGKSFQCHSWQRYRNMYLKGNRDRV